MVVLAAVVFAVGAAPKAQALSLTFNLAGTISQVSDSDPLFDGSVTGGTTFNGSHVFDSNTLDLLPADPNNGFNISDTPRDGLTLHSGNYTVQTAPMQFFTTQVILHGPNSAVDQYIVESGFMSGSILNPNVLLQLVAPVGFATDALPVVPPSLGNFWGNEFAFSASDNVGHAAERVGQLTSLDPPPVPEPITIFLGGVGLAFLTYAARKRLLTGRRSVLGRSPIGRSIGGPEASSDASVLS